MTIQNKRSIFTLNRWILGGIWLFGAVCDRIWLALDQGIPSPDQLGHLNQALDYWQLFQNSSLEKALDSLWVFSSQIPPLLYLLTLPFFKVFGISLDSATLILLFFSGIFLYSVYDLGKLLFNEKVGLLSAFICQVMPILAYVRFSYTIDYPTTAIVTFTFLILTRFKLNAQENKEEHLFIFKQLQNLGHDLNQGTEKIKIYLENLSLNSLALDRNEQQEIPQKEKKILKEALRIKYSLLPLLKRKKRVNKEKKEVNIINKLRHGLIQFIQDKNTLNALCLILALSSGILTNSTIFFYIIIPLAYLFLSFILCFFSQKKSLLQLLLAVSITLILIKPWYQANWLFMLLPKPPELINPSLTPSLSNPLNPLQTVLYYLQQLPLLLSWLIMVVPFLALLIYFCKRPSIIHLHALTRIFGDSRYQWLILILGGSSLLLILKSSHQVNDLLPLLPLLALMGMAILAYCRGKIQYYLQWGMVIGSGFMMILNCYLPWSQSLSYALGYRYQKYPILSPPAYPQELIATVANVSPYLTNTVGFINDNPQMNPETLSFYGRQQDLKVIGYPLSVWQDQQSQEVQSLDWLVGIQSPNINILSNSPQQLLLSQLATDPHFQLQQQWQLDAETTLLLYHRSQPLLNVQRISQPRGQVQLDYLKFPAQAPPGFPIPVTYEWSGQWNDLETGMVFLTWAKPSLPESSTWLPSSRQGWLHDHPIGMGKLHPHSLFPEQKEENYRVIETTAMLPSIGVDLGTYELSGFYLNSVTGETYPLSIPEEQKQMTIDLNGEILPASETDFLSQLRSDGLYLKQGTQTLPALIETVMRLYRLDAHLQPVQDLETTLNYRLAQMSGDESIIPAPQARQDWLYSLMVAQILQRNSEDAIASLQEIINHSPNNPYPHLYLASVYLYNWNPSQATQALNSAIALNGDLPEIKIIRAGIALMTGHFLQAKQELEAFKRQSQSTPALPDEAL